MPPLPPAAGGTPRATGPADATARETHPVSPKASRPAAEPPLDRAALESLATAAVARRLAAVEPEIAPPWVASGRRFDHVRFDGDGEPRIEVHIDRVEVVQSTPPSPSPPAAPPPRPRHRGFAELATTRGHARRRWC